MIVFNIVAQPYDMTLKSYQRVEQGSVLQSMLSFSVNDKTTRMKVNLRDNKEPIIINKQNGKPCQSLIIRMLSFFFQDNYLYLETVVIC